MYNSRDYTFENGDPYDPLLCGVASYFVPGLGQIMADEVGRGLTFTGIFAGSLAVSMVGITKLMLANPNQNGSSSNNGVGMLIGGAVVGVVTQYWSVADAVRVAKINSMAYRDRSGRSYKMEFLPFCFDNRASMTKLSLGATLKIKL